VDINGRLVDYGELRKTMMSSLRKRMDDKALPKIKEIEKKNIDKEVYSVYEPKRYVRRRYIGSSESLYNENNIVGITEEVAGWSFLYRAVNITDTKERYVSYLTPLLVLGYGDKNQPYNRPRDFIKPTQKAVDGLNFESLLKG
jgi:hypothetical protein